MFNDFVAVADFQQTLAKSFVLCNNKSLCSKIQDRRQEFKLEIVLLKTVVLPSRGKIFLLMAVDLSYVNFKSF